MGFPSQLAALANEFIGDKRLLSASGYQKLPGGLIIQWGRALVGTAVTFPVSFPNDVLHANAIYVGGSTSLVSINSSTLGRSGFNTNGAVGVQQFWIAIGY